MAAHQTAFVFIGAIIAPMAIYIAMQAHHHSSQLSIVAHGTPSGLKLSIPPTRTAPYQHYSKMPLNTMKLTGAMMDTVVVSTQQKHAPIYPPSVYAFGALVSAITSFIIITFGRHTHRSTGAPVSMQSGEPFHCLSVSAGPAGAKQPASAPAGKYTLTGLESNSFALELEGTKLLIDPWLTETLTFADAQWLYEGKKRQISEVPFTPEQVPDLFDAVVLTQGLDDHAHLPTLRRIPKTMPIIANTQGAEVCRGLGFKNITTLKAGDSFTVKNVEIQAFRGSLVGPPWSEPQNGYCFKVGDYRVVTEPHGNLPQLNYQCDVLIMPVVSQELGGYPLVNGIPEALAAAQNLKPKLFIPLENGEIDSTGALALLLKEIGSIPSFQAALKASGLATNVVRMEPYRGIPILPIQDFGMAATTSARLMPLGMQLDQIKDAFLGSLSVNPIQAFANKAKITTLKRRLALLVEPLNYGADMTPEQAAEVLELVEEFKALNPTPSPVASDAIDARWKLLWTTEKEQLFFVKNGLFGSEFVAATQDIDRASGRLQNLITFENGDYFQVSSALAPEPPQRCSFEFKACRCKRGRVDVPLPPVGKGWFDTVFLDDTLRIAEDIRGDTLIVARDTSTERFTVPNSA